jgi:uncharacterized protein (DUF433 family)
MADGEPKPYKNYRWIIADPEWLGGKPTVRGTRLSVSLILECLSAEMSLQEINENFASSISAEALAEVLSVGAELADKPCVAA